MEVIFDYYKSYNGDFNTLKQVLSLLGISSLFTNGNYYWSSSQGLPPSNSPTATKYAVAIYNASTQTKDKSNLYTVLACYDFTE